MGNSENSDKGMAIEKKDEEESSLRSSLKAGAAVAASALLFLGGAAVAAGALLSYGAFKMLSSSSLVKDLPEETARKISAQNYGGHRRTTRANKSAYRFENISQNASEQKIKIMTYNVWLHEDVAIDVGMRAICDLIEQHGPDVVLFQEVTPKIYKIFQRELGNDYKFSLSPEQATCRSNFCMLLSKLPMKPVGISDPINLHMARIAIPNGKILMVATTHLPQQTKPHERNKTARMDQATQAIKSLDWWQNVVFGGDMNWVDNSDGPFPLKNNWVDAWLKLKPEEDGSTYNTRTNEMLSGRRPLQKRLDRFFCKLRDFELINVEIIGSDPVPEASYQDHPVYPSDHYGLVLTIE